MTFQEGWGMDQVVTAGEFRMERALHILYVLKMFKTGRRT